MRPDMNSDRFGILSHLENPAVLFEYTISVTKNVPQAMNADFKIHQCENKSCI